jgi:hypothetical protein
MLTGVDHVILVGGFSDRGEVIGTFSQFDDALNYAQQYINEHWEIVPLYRPLDPAID